MSDNDCSREPDCLGTTDPSGIPFGELDPALLRTQRTSVKWTRFAADVLPMFVAEMDFAVAPEIRQALIERVEASDIGYLDGPGPLAPAFADFARDRWGWAVDPSHVHLVTDVATGVVEALRVGRPNGGRLAMSVPVYPGFYEMLEELPFEVLELPLREAADGARAGAPVSSAAAGLDLAAIELAFASEEGVDAFLLCNPHNPHGIAFTEAELRELARLAAAYDVFVVSDEIHAPLAHADTQFTPFAPLAAEAGALAVTTTSASKGWNIAGSKCAVLVASDERSDAVLQQLPPETTTRASILGLHASVAAFTQGRDWLDRTVAQVERNEALFAELVAAHLPGVRYTRPRASYVAWLDFSGAGIGENPHARILEEALVALNDGAFFGPGGEGHVRLNLACAPDTIREAVRRIAAILPAHSSTDTEFVATSAVSTATPGSAAAPSSTETTPQTSETTK